MLAKSKIFGRRSGRRILSHVLIWVFFALLFLIGFIGIQPIVTSLALVATIIGLSVPAVYLHFFLVEKVLRAKRLFWYILSVLLLLLLYGRVIRTVVDAWIFPNDTGTYITGEFMLAMFLLMASGLHYFVAGLQDKNKLAETEAQKTKAQLDSLKMQMNPHFLFNSLNNIYGLMEEDSAAAQSVLQLSSLLRYMLDTSKKSLVNLRKEVQFMESYLALERLRTSAECRIELFKEESFSAYEIPPFLLLPFVENAFKHGKMNGDDSFVLVDIGVKDGELHCNVKNSMRKNSSSGHQLGMANVKRRLELLDKAYSLEIRQISGTYEVRLKLKL